MNAQLGLKPTHIHQGTSPLSPLATFFGDSNDISGGDH